MIYDLAHIYDQQNIAQNTWLLEGLEFLNRLDSTGLGAFFWPYFLINKYLKKIFNKIFKTFKKCLKLLFQNSMGKQSIYVISKILI